MCLYVRCLYTVRETMKSLVYRIYLKLNSMLHLWANVTASSVLILFPEKQNCFVIEIIKFGKF